MEEEYIENEQGTDEQGTDLVEMTNNAMSRINTVMDAANDLSSNFNQMVQTFADMKVEMKRMDTQLESFIHATDVKLDKFKLQVPILEKQLDRIADNIEKVTDKIISYSDESELGLKRQSMLLDTLTQINNSFNGMIIKLMEF